MSDLSLNETIKLLFRAMGKPADFTGKITLHFGQNCGLRNPQITDRDLKAKLLPALKLIAQRGLVSVKHGGCIELHFNGGKLSAEHFMDNAPRLTDPKTDPVKQMRRRWFEFLKSSPTVSLTECDRSFVDTAH